MSINRTDTTSDIQYPVAPDARGSTRIHYARRPYYMGPHQSPQSYVMFGLWKQRLMQSGEPPKPSELRPVIDAVLSAEPVIQPITKSPKTVPCLLIGVAALSLAIVFAAKILSTNPPPKVDDVALSEDEIQFIRGIRRTTDRVAMKAQTPETRADRLVQKLAELRAGNGAQRIHSDDF